MKIDVLLRRANAITVGSQMYLVVPLYVPVTLFGPLDTVAAGATIAVHVLGGYCCCNV